jgi:hypothetical protein
VRGRAAAKECVRERSPTMRYLTVAIVAFVGVSMAAGVACSSSDDSGSPVDAGAADVDATAIIDAGVDVLTSTEDASYGGLRINDDRECYPRPLVTDDAGEVQCRVLLLFASGACADQGLSAATASDVAAIDSQAIAEGAPTPTGPLCVLPQIPGAACTQNPADGWCYVVGSCQPDAGCAQDICTSSGYDAGSDFAAAWLACP